MQLPNSIGKSDCCGCKACAEICPKHCISMEADDDGFFYPQINQEQCVSCGLCAKVCPVTFKDFYPNSEVEAYVGAHNNEQVVYESSSGGAFTAICQAVIRQGYTVYGARYTDDLQVIHDCATTEEDCNAFKKSKYILSDTNGCFGKVAQQLKKSEPVLFSGTPCQCAALQKYLEARNVSRDSLITVSILCRGTPSQKVFDIHRKELEEQHGAALTGFTFRSKASINGKLNARSATLTFSDGTTQTLDATTNAFLKAYYSGLFTRSSCGTCRFARMERMTDITLGDAWGINKLYPELDPMKGVSLIFAATPQGKALVKSLEDTMSLTQLDTDYALKSQSIMRGQTRVHYNRSLFFKLLKKHGRMDLAVKKASRLTVWQRVKGKIKSYIIPSRITK